MKDCRRSKRIARAGRREVGRVRQGHPGARPATTGGTVSDTGIAGLTLAAASAGSKGPSYDR
jgi:hypothetical protein